MNLTKLNSKKVVFELESVSSCPLCSSTYHSLYTNLQDYSYPEAEPIWNWSACNNQLCQTHFLNPRPSKKTIYLAYDNYYTYTTNSSSAVTNVADSEVAPLLNIADNHSPLKAKHFQTTSVDKNIESKPQPHLKSSLLLKNLLNGFVKLSKEVLRFLFEGWVRWTSIPRLRNETNYLGLLNQPAGSVLEVGCGSGDRLALLQQKGWTVLGQDIDPKAAQYAASKHQLKIFSMPVDELPIEPKSMDAIVLSHVIEHVHEPQLMVQQILKYLKPNGVIVLITPNSNSFIRKLFGRFWIHTEHPRHLILFNPKNFLSIVPEALKNYTTVETTPGNAQFTALYSFEIWLRGYYNLQNKTYFISNIVAGFLQLLALIVWWFDKSSGEELIMKVENKP